MTMEIKKSNQVHKDGPWNMLAKKKRKGNRKRKHKNV